jgi:hypothetical protein
MSQETDKEKKDETLPTYIVGEDPELYDAAIAITNELIIVSFYLPTRSEPLIVTGAKTITIGRRDPKRNINPRIDLTEDDGAKLGVSRLHAELNLVNEDYYLKDMGSSNGTWVNKTKLEPYQPHIVKTGDEIRIGQIKIGVHITLPIRAEIVSTLMENKNRNKQYGYIFVQADDTVLVKKDGIIPSILPNISTYLNQVAEIYSIIREAQEHEALGFQITAIYIKEATTDLRVDIGEGADIMNFLAKKLATFLAVLEGKKKSEARQTESLERYPEPIEQIADYALQEMVFKFLGDEVRDDYVSRLKTHFDVLIGSKLKIEPIS